MTAVAAAGLTTALSAAAPGAAVGSTAGSTVAMAAGLAASSTMALPVGAAAASGLVVGLVAPPIRRHVTTRMQSRSNGVSMDRYGTAKVRNVDCAAEPTVDKDTTTSF